MSLMEIQNLTYYYPDSPKPAMKNIDFTLDEGEFILVAGSSGSGKSSLARVLAGLIPDFYGGRLIGRVFFNGSELRDAERRLLCSSVGIVFQDPEKQLVMTSVEAEIAFGLENLGLPQDEMFRRISEVMSFLGLSPLQQEFTANLSGGQKQKVALAAVLAMQPRLLILDEPTSQLDPMAAEEFLNLVERLNKELGYTVLLIEQRLERCFHLADRLLVMERGEIVCDAPAAEAARWQVAHAHGFIPPVARLFALLDCGAIPLTVKDGRRELKRMLPASTYSAAQPAANKIPQRQAPREKLSQNPAVLEARDLWFTYPNGREALKGINCSIGRGDFAVILGENAAGKTTFLKQAAGLLKPGRGSVAVVGKDTRAASLPDLVRHIGYLSQNPNDYLFQDTVEEELRFTLDNLGIYDHGVIENVLTQLGLSAVRGVNPRDLSGGERQRVALASVLVANPELLLLDEPTRGIDYLLKAELGVLLQRLNRQGMTIVMVTHDVEFAAEYASRVILMFDGRIASDGTARQVLENSLFYSPQAARLFRGFADDVLTVRDGIEVVGKIIRTGGELVNASKPK